MKAETWMKTEQRGSKTTLKYKIYINPIWWKFKVQKSSFCFRFFSLFMRKTRSQRWMCSSRASIGRLQGDKPVKSQNINELTLHQDQCWSSQGLKNFALMKKDYSPKNEVLQSPPLCLLFFIPYFVFVFPHSPNISEIHTHIFILCIVTNETPLQVARLFLFFSIFMPTLLICGFEFVQIWGSTHFIKKIIIIKSVHLLQSVALKHP